MASAISPYLLPCGLTLNVTFLERLFMLLRFIVVKEKLYLGLHNKPIFLAEIPYRCGLARGYGSDPCISHSRSHVEGPVLGWGIAFSWWKEEVSN
jgi:hypothetical protein